MNNFLYQNKTKVFFGKGGVGEYLGCTLKEYGDTVMLAYGGGSIKQNGVYDEVMKILHTAHKRVVEFPGIMPNPTYTKVQEGAKLARENDVDLILAVGGGSVSDCCKIVSAQAKLKEDIWELETIKHTYPSKFIPLGTIITVFGTGSEMNNGAVITHEAKKIKTGILGAQAEFAFLDPIYSMSVPIKQVISGAFDTLSHAMETYFGKPEQNNLSDDMNEAVMRSVIHNIRKLLAAPESYNARSELAWASAMAENGILKVGRVTDFECHQMEHQLGAYTDCNHGQGLAVLHPAYYRHIVKDAPEKFARLGQVVFGVEGAEAAVDALASFIKECSLPTKLTELRSKVAITPELLRQVADSTNLLPNGSRQITHDEVYQIFMECL